jgi:hypothetical protein
MLHEDCAEHETVLAAPTCNLHVVLVLHIAVERAPSLKSQSELALHATTLPSPPMPLHSELLLQPRVSTSVELPLHFADAEQLSAHASSPHSVLQSVPAVQLHEVSAHTQPVPEQVGAEPPPPQAAVAITMQRKIDRMSQLPRCATGAKPLDLSADSRSALAAAQPGLGTPWRPERCSCTEDGRGYGACTPPFLRSVLPAPRPAGNFENDFNTPHPENNDGDILHHDEGSDLDDSSTGLTTAIVDDLAFLVMLTPGVVARRA